MTYIELAQRVQAADKKELCFLLGLPEANGPLAVDLIGEALRAAQALNKIKDLPPFKRRQRA